MILPLRRLVFPLLCCLSGLGQADVAVIVHPDSGASLTPAQVASVYLGLDRSMTPVDLRQWGDTRTHFYHQLIRKNEAQLKSHWAALIFTGKGRPPQGVPDESAMLDRIATDPRAIGYVDRERVDDRVHVLFVVP